MMFIEADQLRIVRISHGTGYISNITGGVEKHTYLLWEPLPANRGGLPMTFLGVPPGRFGVSTWKYIRATWKERVVRTM